MRYQIGGRLVPLDRYGFPIGRIKGRWLANLIRVLLHTRKIVRGPLVYEVVADPAVSSCDPVESAPGKAMEGE